MSPGNKYISVIHGQMIIISTPADDVGKGEHDFEKDKKAFLQEYQKYRASNGVLQTLGKEALKEVHSRTKDVGFQIHERKRSAYGDQLPISPFLAAVYTPYHAGPPSLIA